jgi:hypothetical protein
MMQLFMDLFAVQCMPTGRCHWDITTEKNIKMNGLLTPLERGRLD